MTVAPIIEAANPTESAMNRALSTTNFCYKCLEMGKAVIKDCFNEVNEFSGTTSDAIVKTAIALEDFIKSNASRFWKSINKLNKETFSEESFGGLLKKYDYESEQYVKKGDISNLEKQAINLWSTMIIKKSYDNIVNNKEFYLGVLGATLTRFSELESATACTVGTGGVIVLEGGAAVLLAPEVITVVVVVGGIAVTIAVVSTGMRFFSKKSEDLSKNNRDDKNYMLGKNGVLTNGSKTIWQNGATERIDIENILPGKCPASLHYHDVNNNKWCFDLIKKVFYEEGFVKLAPPRIQKLLENPETQKAINKALKYLGENPIFL